jgi:peptide/nickel transport system permease protein
MRGFVFRRTAQAVFVILLSQALTFFTLFVLPGDPIYNKLHSPINPLPKSAVGPLLSYYHFNDSPLEQYLLSLKRIVTGDLGYSLQNGHAVTELLGRAIPQTLTLAVMGLTVAFVLALTVALAAVFTPSSALRNLARLLPGLFLSTPSFVLGFLLLQIFSFQLGWFSAIEAQGLRSYVLPAVTLGIGVTGPIAQVLITGLSRAAGEPFVTVLRAKGVRPVSITGRHILKNGSIPTLTLLALTVGDLLAGAVVVETVFNMTGVGMITQQSVRDQDTPVVMAVVVLVSTIYVAVNLVTDLLYPVIDRRISITPERRAGRWRLRDTAWVHKVSRAVARKLGRRVAAA